MITDIEDIRWVSAYDSSAVFSVQNDSAFWPHWHSDVGICLSYDFRACGTTALVILTYKVRNPHNSLDESV